jgi:cytochrome c-type biogenesis protein CcmH
MALGALAFVVLPLLLARAKSEPVSDAGSNVAIFKSQRRELDDELNRGAINEAEHSAALSELSSRVADEVPAQQAVSSGIATLIKRPWWLVAGCAIAMPLFAFLLYGKIGTPQAIDMTAATPAHGAASGGMPGEQMGTGGSDSPIPDKQIMAMVDTLAQKMAQNPGDPKGWILLARSQNALGRFAEASAAFERAVALTPKDAQLLADYADATVMAQDGRFEGKPYALIKQSLKIDPNGMKALALAGTAELRMGNRAASLVHWEKLKTLVAKDSPDYREVESIIEEVKTGKAPDSPAPPVAAMPTPAPAAAAPAMQAANGAAAKSGVKVTGKVVLAPAIAAKLADGGTLFVFARAKEGPRMPLAVLRIPAPKVNAFPFAFELTEAMAMAPGMSLSSFPEVVIEARISRSGNAPIQSGDLFGINDSVKPGASGITVTIGKVAP